MINFFVKERVTLAAIHAMMHKLMVLLNAKIPMIQCVMLLEKAEQSVTLKQLLYFAQNDLATGKSISESFLWFSQYVEPIFYQLTVGNKIAFL